MPENLWSAIMSAAHTHGNQRLHGDGDMTSQKQQLSREEFNRLAEMLGVSGEPDYMDELYNQVRGVFMMGESIMAIDVTGAEPDMAFIPPIN